MENLIPKDDQIAYAEILYLINTMDRSYIDKLPEELMDFFKQASMKDYEVKIDESTPFYKENFKDYTIEIFNVLNLNFWCDDEEQRRDAITYLIDKPVEFKLNKQIGITKGQEGNYFEEILEQEKQKQMVLEKFKEDIEKNKREEVTKQDETKEEIEEKKSIFLKIKKIFKK